MFSSKRFVIASIMGITCGLICFGLASSSPNELPTAVAWQIIFSRALIGFAIGISIFKMVHWSIHGGVIGILFSIPLAFSGLMAPDSPEFSKTTMFIMTIVLGLIYGVFIEFVTSSLFKAKMIIAEKSV